MALWSCYFCAFANGLMTATLTSYIPTYYKEVLHLDLTSVIFLNSVSFTQVLFFLYRDRVISFLLLERTPQRDSVSRSMDCQNRFFRLGRLAQAANKNQSQSNC